MYHPVKSRGFVQFLVPVCIPVHVDSSCKPAQVGLLHKHMLAHTFEHVKMFALSVVELELTVSQFYMCMCMCVLFVCACVMCVQMPGSTLHTDMLYNTQTTKARMCTCAQSHTCTLTHCLTPPPSNS